MVLDTILYGNSIMQYLSVIIYFIAAYVGAKVVYYILKNVIGTLTKKTETRFDDVLLELAEKPIILFVAITGVYFGILQLTLDPGAINFIDSGYFLLSAVISAWFGIKLVGAFFTYWLEPFAEKSNSTLDDQLLPVADKVVKLGVIISVTIMILSRFGYDVSALVAGLGIGGLAIALASKDYLENIVAGLTIFTDKPFRLNDRVKIDGTSGTIKEVGIRSTRILTFDNTLVIIPNSKMVQSKLTNVSAPDRTIAVRLDLGLTYDTSNAKLDKAKKIVAKSITSTDGVANKPPSVFFKSFGDSSLNLWVKYWITNYSSSLSIKDSVNTKIKSGFEKAKIDFAYPTRTVYNKK